MPDPSLKWQLHHRIIAVVGSFAALLFLLFAVESQQQRGLDGLGAGIAAVALAVGTIAYLAITTLVVTFVHRRRDVWLVHLVSPFALVASCVAPSLL